MKPTRRLGVLASSLAMLATSASADDLKVKAEVIARSGLVRVTWQGAGDRAQRYEVERKVGLSVRPFGFTARDALVFLDAEAPLGDAVRYQVSSYDAKGAWIDGQKGESSPLTRNPTEASTLLSETFDSGILDRRWQPTPVGEVPLPWRIAEGKLTLGKHPDALPYSLDLDLQPVPAAAGRGWELTARGLISEGPAGPTAGPLPLGGIGFRSRDGKAILVSAIVVKVRDEFRVELRGADDQLLDTYVPLKAFPDGSPFWIYLQVEGDQVRVGLWADDLNTQAETEKEGVKAVEVKGLVPAELRPALISKGQATIAFGEVYVAGLGEVLPPTLKTTPFGEENEPVERPKPPVDLPPDVPADAPVVEPPPPSPPPPPPSTYTPQFPLTQTASVVRILRPNELDPDAETNLRLLESSSLKGLPGVKVLQTFETPARFPILRFSSGGGEFESDGAMIAEGMRVAAAPDGSYEIDLVMTVPAMPAVMRLQLDLGYGPDGHRSLTLPPLAIPPYKNERGESEIATYQIRFTGHSQVIQRKWSDCPPRMARSGSVRFGSYPTEASRPY